MMSTMTEMFYGPVEPARLMHPLYNPYLVYGDGGFVQRRNSYMQGNAGPYAMVGHDGTPVQPSHGAMYPYQAQYYVHGGHGANGRNSNANNGNQNQKQGQSPVQTGVSQPPNAIDVQTLHFVMPLCCDKCEATVKAELFDLDDHVESVVCDQWKQKVTVTSAIAPEKLLKRLQKIKKSTSFWPHQQSGAVKVFNFNQKGKDIEN